MSSRCEATRMKYYAKLGEFNKGFQILHYYYQNNSFFLKFRMLQQIKKTLEKSKVKLLNSFYINSQLNKEKKN